MRFGSRFGVRSLRRLVVAATALSLAAMGSVSVAAPGDVNDDGSIDEEDMVLIVGHILWRAILTGDALSRADANQDGNVDVADVVWGHLHQTTPTPTPTPAPTPTPGQSLADAVDNTSLVFYTYGDALWFLETATTHYGGDAAQSGPIGADEASMLRTTVNGPGTISFWWKVSSEDDYDYLDFSPSWWNGATVGVSGEMDWGQQSLTVPPGPQSVEWIYSKDDSGDVGADAGWVDLVEWSPSSIPSPDSSLSEAVDNAALNFSTGGSAPWFRQTSVSQNDGDAAQSGPVDFDEVTWMTTTVTGPGTLSFSWKVSSAQFFDELYCYRDSLLDGAIDSISGEQDWTATLVPVPSGTHTVTWVFAKVLPMNVGLDCGWVDNVVWTPGP